MKTANFGIFVLALAAWNMSGAASGATIAWNTVSNISGAADVSLTGHYVDAIRAYSDNAGGFPTLSVNGVAFQETNFTTAGSIYTLSDASGDIVLCADSTGVSVVPPNSAMRFSTTSNTGNANYDGAA